MRVLSVDIYNFIKVYFRLINGLKKKNKSKFSEKSLKFELN